MRRAFGNGGSRKWDRFSGIPEVTPNTHPGEARKGEIMKPRTKKTHDALPARAERRLTAYAIAATAVGAGALAGTPAMANEIGMVDVTITQTSGPQLVPIADRNYELQFMSGTLIFQFASFFEAVYDNENEGALRFQTGQVIGSSQIGFSRGILAASAGTLAGGSRGGPWTPAGPGDTTHGFLGVNFYSGALINGWVRTSVHESASGALTAHVDEWGIASSFRAPVLAGQGQTPLPTPEPNALGLFALGAVGLLALRWRRRASQTETQS
jgi:PEP-CTERM motif